MLFRSDVRAVLPALRNATLARASNGLVFPVPTTVRTKPISINTYDSPSLGYTNIQEKQMFTGPYHPANRQSRCLLCLHKLRHTFKHRYPVYTNTSWLTHQQYTAYKLTCRSHTHIIYTCMNFLQTYSARTHALFSHAMLLSQSGSGSDGYVSKYTVWP